MQDLKKQAIKNNINYVGFGEIIVQHAPHNHKKLKYEGINNDLNSKRIVRAIDIVLKDNKPVILHIELNDYEEDSKKILSQLVKLSKKYPNDNFNSFKVFKKLFGNCNDFKNSKPVDEKNIESKEENLLVMEYFKFKNDERESLLKIISNIVKENSELSKNIQDLEANIEKYYKLVL